MMLPLYQVDAFCDQLFSGNPAAVCPLNDWLPDDTLQAIAAENNLAETAFFVAINPAQNHYQLRWFTPTLEVDLCGHATLASAFVLFELLGAAGSSIRFDSRSGPLLVSKTEKGLTLDFPLMKTSPVDIPPAIMTALGQEPLEAQHGVDLLLLFASQKEVMALSPDFSQLAQQPYRGIIATAEGDDCDFVSRFFAPACGINEDPVTGSAHCALTPYWSEKLGKKTLSARQLSPRGGQLTCQLSDNRVFLSGKAVCYLSGHIHI
ncbi:MAG: PhzF family phenazine biosynthesis protein [Gammaproteobacteria bacterium]|nr:MAG: PhzF family phenazine biosynthesis protein [Gammaproteobacteria bacterium]